MRIVESFHGTPSSPLPLLPRPRSIHGNGTSLLLTSALRVDTDHTGDKGVAARAMLARAANRRGLPQAQEGAPLLRFLHDRLESPEAYRLEIDDNGIRIAAGDPRGSFYGCATLAQLIGSAASQPAGPASGIVLPGMVVSDAPGLARRGLMLDVSRDRVPTMETLEGLVELFAGWKLNELQLYTEHTFAYAGHEEVWRGLDPLTPADIRHLDAFCGERHIELVPNQQSFGHMHRWLTHARYRPMAECPDGLEHPFSPDAEPFSLCPGDPRSLAFLEDLYDQLLPCFSSRELHVGFDETFDLGQGRSREDCQARGIGRVHLDFLKAVHRLVEARGKRTWFWADIVLNHPEVHADLPANAVACSWGYEAGHDFDQELSRLAEAGVDAIACPGTSTWKSFAGRPNNMRANIRHAAQAAARHAALGILTTDWGDQGHLQPLPASFPAWGIAADCSWNPGGHALSRDELAPAVDRDAFDGMEGSTRAWWSLGRVGERVGDVPNATPLFQIVMRSDAFPPEVDPALTSDRLERALAEVEGLDRPGPSLAPLTRGHAGRDHAGSWKLLAEELSWARAAQRFACVLGLERMRHPTSELQELPAPAGAQLSEDLSALLAEHRRLWPMRTRPSGLEDSSVWFERLLAKLARRPG